jgi:hypothetical protein
VAAKEVGAALGGAREGREDDVVVLPEGTRGEPFLVLARTVAPRASVALVEHFMERPLPFLGCSKMWPVLVWLSVRLMWSVAVAVEGHVDVVDGTGGEPAV